MFADPIPIGDDLLALAPAALGVRHLARIGGHVLIAYVAIEELRVVGAVLTVVPRAGELERQLGYDVARLLVQIALEHWLVLAIRIGRC